MNDLHLDDKIFFEKLEKFYNPNFVSEKKSEKKSSDVIFIILSIFNLLKIYVYFDIISSLNLIIQQKNFLVFG